MQPQQRHINSSGQGRRRAPVAMAGAAATGSGLPMGLPPNQQGKLQQQEGRGPAMAVAPLASSPPVEAAARWPTPPASTSNQLAGHADTQPTRPDASQLQNQQSYNYSP